VHRVLAQLEANGLIVRDAARDRFSIGPRLSRLALASLYSNNQGAPIRAILQALVDDIRETCNLGVLDGLELLYLERIECDWSLRVHLQAGSRVPAHCTSGGKALLAFLPDDLRARLIAAAALEAYTENTITEPQALEAELARTRERGYALNDQEFSVGIMGAAVPVLDARGRALAALALHAPVARLSVADAARHVPKLQAAAKRLAKAWHLGGGEGELAA
jgi:DNA-binding IclR family transcriptional regulator